MCGRYSFAPKPAKQAAIKGAINKTEPIKFSYNIAPTQEGYVVANDRPDQLQRMAWGLVPHWSANGTNSGKLINARAEGIAKKPSFRESIRQRRCLVPADSFYEWRKEPGGRKIPYRIFLEDENLLYMAGIWDEWAQNGVIKRTFSIITTTPNSEMATLHHRMPVILPDENARQRWLANLPEEAILAMLHPLKDGALVMYRVSEKLNKPGYDAPNLHEKTEEQQLTLF